MQDLDRLPHSDVVALARRARSRLRNAEIEKQRIMQRFIAVAVGGGAALGMGYVMGMLHQQAANEGTAGTDNDPSKLFGVDLDIWAGGLLTIAGLALSGSKKTQQMGEYVEAAGTGIVSGVAYSFGVSLGKEAA